MANRKLYRLEPSGDGVIVYRTDHNYGRQGVVYSDRVRFEYTPYRIPQYIQDECRAILIASAFELSRGYTFGGKSCHVDAARR